MSLVTVWSICAYLFWTLTSVGMLFDNSPNAWPNELLRSSVFLIIYSSLGTWSKYRVPQQILLGTYGISVGLSLSKIMIDVFMPMKKEVKTE